MTADRDTETAPERANEMDAKSAALAYRGKMTTKLNAKAKRNQKRAPKALLAPARDAAPPAPAVQAEKRPPTAHVEPPPVAPAAHVEPPPVAPAVQVEAPPSVAPAAPSNELVVQGTPRASERERFRRKAKAAEPPPTGEFDTAAENLAKLVDQGRRVMAAAMSAPDLAETRSELAANVADATKTLGVVAEYWMTQPERAAMAQADLISGLTDIWSQTLHRFSGEETPPVVPPDPSD